MKKRNFNNKQYLICIIILSSTFFFINSNHKDNEKKHALNHRVKFSIPKLNNLSITKPLDQLPRVCILVPVCSRMTDWKSVNESFFLTIFLGSMYKTSEFSKYNYSIYLGYDKDDLIFDNEQSLQFLFREMEKYNAEFDTMVTLRPISFLNLLKKPGPIMNYLSQTAYSENCDFLYRINDDTEFLTPWTTPFIQTLASFQPPYTGVVGPTCHQGNPTILTHDFVHKSHLEIFEFHYPHELTDWWLDDWISSVYGEPNTKKLENVEVNHHVLVTRYNVKSENGEKWSGLVQNGKNRLLQYHSRGGGAKPKLVSYSLYGNDPRYLNGAVENVRLLKTIFKGWKMRIYFDSSVPPGLLLFLVDNGVELIDMTESKIKNKMSWRFLPTQNFSIERFISRDIDARLSEREFFAVQEWIESKKPFHVMRDHPSHTGYTVSGGMWGSVGGAIPELEKWLEESSVGDQYMDDMNFLDKKIWPEMKLAGVFAHDSFSCDLDSNKRFPTERDGLEHVGSVYMDGAIREGDANILKEALNNGMPKC